MRENPTDCLPPLASCNVHLLQIVDHSMMPCHAPTEKQSQPIARAPMGRGWSSQVIASEPGRCAAAAAREPANADDKVVFFFFSFYGESRWRAGGWVGGSLKMKDNAT